MIDVLIVDDSALVRKVLTDIIQPQKDLNLIGAVHDPIFAIERLKQHQVDVIILDIEMPRMDGLTFLEKLMRVKPTAVIILSSLTQKNAQLSLNAFELGAFEVLAKPDDLLSLGELENDLLRIVRKGGTQDVKRKLMLQYRKSAEARLSKPREEGKSLFTLARKTTDKVIVLGSSTGGTTRIEEILSRLPADVPGIVIVQHMPLKYTTAFAERLNSKILLNIKIAEQGERIVNGSVYIAPGEKHCAVYSSGAKYYIQISDGPRINYHKPSVEHLFKSAAQNVGQNAVGIMLTGMGEDGSRAMKEMRDAGSYNIVQDEESSVVWGMPGKAVEYGAAHEVVPADQIAARLCDYLQKN